MLWVYDKVTKKELLRATTLDDMTITFGSMGKIPDPLHGGAYPSVTVVRQPAKTQLCGSFPSVSPTSTVARQAHGQRPIVFVGKVK